MVTKLKNLIINDSKAKFILLLLLFLLVSILFEAVYDLNNNFSYNINYYYKEFALPYFYFFGTPVHLSKVELEFVCIGIILSSFLLTILCFTLYKKNKQTKVKFLENVISLFSKVKIELTLILTLILLTLRFHAFTSNKMFYNTNLIIYNFIIISIVYIIYENIKYNNYNLKDMSITYVFFSNLLNMYNKKL
ncbi:hypothetical protein CDIFJ21_23890 [Clostridioides difficile]|nr:hypothetical protein CDIFJ21_23890 [Clostridioides difficile]